MASAFLGNLSIGFQIHSIKVVLDGSILMFPLFHFFTINHSFVSLNPLCFLPGSWLTSTETRLSQLSSEPSLINTWAFMATWNQVFEIKVVSADAGCMIVVCTLFLRKHFLCPNQHAAGLSLLMVFFAGMSLSIKKKNHHAAHMSKTRIHQMCFS